MDLSRAQRVRTSAAGSALPEDRSEVTDAPLSLEKASAVGIQGARRLRDESRDKARDDNTKMEQDGSAIDAKIPQDGSRGVNKDQNVGLY